MNTKGFTLMEILAVLLILAVITMFSLPAVRATRSLMQHHQAKSAAVKMAEAMRTYYQNTKGYLITGSLRGKLIDGDSESLSVVNAAEQSCNNAAMTGIPATTASGVSRTSSMVQLFACDFLSTKDFAGLPYTFAAHSDPFNKENNNDDFILLTVTGTTDAGTYKNKSFTVHRDGSVREGE